MFRAITDHWKKFFSNPTYRYLFILTVVLLIVELTLFKNFLLFVEARKGVVLPDPLFNYFSATDFNIPIFIIIYGSLSVGLISLMQHPRHLMHALQTFIIMVLFRATVMYLMPLEEPAACIDLKDPLVFAVGTGQIITKDLFFSGHVASLTILFLTAKNKYLKYIFLALTVTLAVLIFLQKNHYTIDIITAPFFVFAAWSLAKTIDSTIFFKFEHR